MRIWVKRGYILCGRRVKEDGFAASPRWGHANPLVPALLAIAALACALPAHRATRVDPILALRGE